MKTFFDCLPCLVRQALDSVRMVTDDEQTHETILREVLQMAGAMDFGVPPAAMAQRLHRRIRELTGIDDPYREAKDRLNARAMELCESLRPRIAGAADPMEAALRLAIAGNIMDLGVKTSLDDGHVCRSIENCLNEPFEADIGAFWEAMSGAERILYLADNAGEIAFDRLLIEQLPREKVTVAVRGGAVINDATLDDAEEVGLADLVEVIGNGSDAPGTLLDDCSDGFCERFAAADVILSKGQGNYETLSESARPIWFLLRVKCPIIARHLETDVGRMVLRRS